MNNDTFQVDNFTVGNGCDPFIIAEMSGNHNGSLDRALEIVDAVAESGAQALKLQTYTADTMTLDLDHGEFTISDPKSLWHGRNLYELYEEAHTPWAWHAPIIERAKEKGIVAFSTPFDATAVDFLETLNMPLYKIASFEIVDHPLIRKVASTGKPMIMSTGMASVAEIHEAVTAAEEGGCQNLVLLKCTSNYPASPTDSNLRTIPHLASLFNTQVGLSDHTLGIGAAVASVALGATVIEKHFTLSRDEGGVDSTFSLEPDELAALVSESATAAKALGQVSYGLTQAEQNSLGFRRSLYFCHSLSVGDVVGPEDVRAIRPGLGLAPKFLDIVIGQRLAKAVNPGTAVSWDCFAAE